MLTALFMPIPFAYDERDARIRELNDLELREMNESYYLWQAELESYGITPLSGRFNNQAAAQYALRWWNVRNPAYRNFDNSGGNCTNFVSQAMSAGGWTHVHGFYRNAPHWWYDYGWLGIQTWSWVGVNHWHDFANIHSRRSTILNNPRNLIVGEVLQVSFDGGINKNHSMIVTSTSTSDIFLTYNSDDTLNASLASLQIRFPNARWVPHLIFSTF